MDRMEIITRTERRRIYNDDGKAAVVAASSEPGVTVREVARRFGIADSLVYNWPSAHRKAASLAQPRQFISYSAVPAFETETPHPHGTPVVPPATMPRSADRVAVAAEETVRPASYARTGTIDITLPSGVHLAVDTFVNEVTRKIGF
ncbi:transposase [Sphingomonas xinjiangensis]|uniref:Transposase n=1 Tax=Sphingomonas xinjiangensis TaxID=643568 RepID=A0A840YSM9_9SPHN|nr:transposase [Sphingomonas xinjiangensis]MBB5712701.1 transposase [Sphingomonas xinjiangensis]